ncbi:MAG: RDD family protein [bacterium]
MEIITPQYAGFWKRFAAYLIDSILLSIVNMIFILPIWIMFGLSIFPFTKFENFEEFSSVALFQQYDEEFLIPIISTFIIAVLMIAVFTTIISWLYFALMESSAKQATLGKMALGIKVTDLMGNRISFGKATGRYFAKILSGMILYIGFIMAGFTEKKQALHDIIAGCLVMNNDYLLMQQTLEQRKVSESQTNI